MQKQDALELILDQVDEKFPAITPEQREQFTRELDFVYGAPDFTPSRLGLIAWTRFADIADATDFALDVSRLAPEIFAEVDA